MQMIEVQRVCLPSNYKKTGLFLKIESLALFMNYDKIDEDTSFILKEP